MEEIRRQGKLCDVTLKVWGPGSVGLKGPGPNGEGREMGASGKGLAR